VTTGAVPELPSRSPGLFGVAIDKEIRRILRVYYRPGSGSQGTSWLTYVVHMKGSLWSCDLFCCASASLTTHWVLTVMPVALPQVLNLLAERFGAPVVCPPVTLRGNIRDILNIGNSLCLG